MRIAAKKIISPVFIIAGLSLFIASTVIFFTRRAETKYYSLSYASYGNISDVLSFQEGVKNKIRSNLDDMFIKNAGEIKTDKNGNVLYLNIDCEVKQNNETFNLQIKSSERSEYTLVRTKSSESNVSNISLKDTLYALSYYDFNLSSDVLDYKFMIRNEVLNNISINNEAKKQYVVSENSINEVTSDMGGTFSRIDILLNEEFEELYFQI